MTISFSSEAEIIRDTVQAGGFELYDLLQSDRFFEVLGHEPNEIDLTRINTSGPVLYSHDASRQIGAVTRARVENKRGFADIKISRNAASHIDDIEDGILRDVSVGATVSEYRVVGERDGIPILRATRWSPREVSLLPMGADISVGVDRSDVSTNHNTTVRRAIMPEENTQTKQPPEAKIDIVSERKRAVEEERKRGAKVLDAIEFCNQRGLEVPADTRRKADENGWQYEQVCAFILENQPESKRGADTKTLDTIQRAEQRQFSLCRAIAGAMSKRGIDGFEAEVIAEVSRTSGIQQSEGGILIPIGALSQRSMLAGVYDQGGSTVPVTTGPMIEKLDPIAVVEAAGATVLRGLTGPTNFPRHTGAAVAHWVAEAATVDASTPGTDDVMVTPHGIAAYVELSRQLAATSSIDAESFVRMEILRRLNLGIDLAALAGSGVAGVPRGVFELNTSTSGINTVAFGGAPSWGKITEFEGAIEADNALMGNLSWITTAPVKAAWKSTSKDTGSGQYLASESNQANGYPILVTSQLAGTSYNNRVVFGNFADMIVGMYGVIEILIDQSAALQRRGIIGITGLAHADVAFRHPESFCVSTDTANQ